MRRINEHTHSLGIIPISSPHQPSPILNSKPSRKITFKNKEEYLGIFKEPGTVLIKYGRWGNPKLRYVYLNPEETLILWRDTKKQ